MITIIVAADQNNLIGKKGTDNGMPWHNSEDFKHFRSTTLNHTLLMGKTTYQAIGKPLPKRHTIVLSHNFEDDRVEVVDDLVGTIKAFKERGEDLFISGGASVYKQALPYYIKFFYHVFLVIIQEKHISLTFLNITIVS